MKLHEYVCWFGDVCLDSKHNLNSKLNPNELRMAEHFYVGLALDLPNVKEARDHLFETSPDYKINFEVCGNNIPLEFKELLERYVEKKTLPVTMAKDDLDQMIDYFMDVVVNYHESGADPFLLSMPLCCKEENQGNKSSLSDRIVLCRYVTIEVFEKYVLEMFPYRKGRRGTASPKTFYDSDRIDEINKDFANGVPVSIGRPGNQMVYTRSLPVPVFFTPMTKAPHRDKKREAKTALHVAQEMGLPDCLESTKGLVALKFKHDKSDKLYRPTFLDAIDHVAFRPGPMEGMCESFRHGWTRKCQKSGALWGPPIILPEKGRMELVMKNRTEIFPSDKLSVEAILFFD
ncbi:MAG: hypothetical protein H7839_05590 [Magnetococcus sp. YQC-5]